MWDPERPEHDWGCPSFGTHVWERHGMMLYNRAFPVSYNGLTVEYVPVGVTETYILERCVRCGFVRGTLKSDRVL